MLLKNMNPGEKSFIANKQLNGTHEDGNEQALASECPEGTSDISPDAEIKLLKAMVLSRSEPQRLIPERQAQVHDDLVDAVDSEVIAVKDDDPIEHASQAHILKVMELMGCDEGYESAVQRLPQIDVHREYNVLVSRGLCCEAEGGNAQKATHWTVYILLHLFTFLSYGYAVHARKGVKASSEEIAQHTHQVQDHEAEQLTLYTKVEELASQLDLFDEPNTQEEMWICACRSPFQIYDKLRCIAMAKLDDDPNRLSEIAAYMVYDFKQKFLAKGFREGEDSYYGNKGMLWWGAGVYIMPETEEVQNQLYTQEEDENDMVEEEKEDESEEDEQEQWEREQEEQGEGQGEQEEEDQQEKEGEGSKRLMLAQLLEAALRALKQKFPHVTKLIVQSDNAKNMAGKQTKLLHLYVCSAAGLKLIAYYHNEAQCGKDVHVYDTHFSHQQTQVDAYMYLMQGDGGRNVSTPKQLAVALINTSVSNTTVLLVNSNFQAPYYAASIPPVVGISEFYATQYVTSAGKQQVQFYNCLGQKTVSACVSIALCHACSLITPMGAEGITSLGLQ
eukprot:Em0030g5a